MDQNMDINLISGDHSVRLSIFRDKLLTPPFQNLRQSLFYHYQL